jgi:hypothetical protein
MRTVAGNCAFPSLANFDPRRGSGAAAGSRFSISSNTINATALFIACPVREDHTPGEGRRCSTSWSSPENHRVFAQRNVMVESVRALDNVTDFLRHVRNAFCASQRETSDIVLRCGKICIAKRPHYGDAHFERHSKTILRIVVMWNFKI